MTRIKLDRVFLYQDQLSFRIPQEWIEGTEDGDHYLYHAPNTNSGWLRVSLITLTSPGKASKERVRAFLTRKARKTQGELFEEADNIVVAWEQMSEENATTICNYNWAVGNNVDSTLSHEALFSYTILAEHCEDPGTQETVALLSRLISEARFGHPKPHA